jgi:mono/diheme cytochrome c family protein
MKRLHIQRGVAALLLGSAALAAVAQSANPFPGVGRAATPKEVAAWDIDVRPDFKGLPKGSGTVVQGMDIWEAKCASCHGVFGESNEVFSPLIGGTTKDDIKTGRVKRLTDEFGLTHEQAAQAVGRSRSTASNLLRLLNLVEPVQQMLMAGDIDMGHARALLPLDGAALEIQYSTSIEKLGLMPGMLGVIFKGARCDIHNPALLKQLKKVL